LSLPTRAVQGQENSRRGSAGHGIVGGLYNLGTATVDAATVFARNDASTSNDNSFGA